MNKNSGDESILCISTRQQGSLMLRELAHLSCRVTLLTIEAAEDAEWPAESLHEFQTMPGGMTLRQIVNTATYLARTRKFVRIIALDAGCVETAAALREHMRIPGMGLTTARYFDDRLAMRARASHLGIRVPAFTATSNDDDVNAFLERIPSPWLVTPRSMAHPVDRQEWNTKQEVWGMLESLGDARSDFMLEQMVYGQEYSIAGITADSQVVHAEISPAIDIPREERELAAIHSDLVPGLGMVRGATNARLLRSFTSHALYFLDIAAQPGHTDLTTNFNPWIEWARIEVAALRGEKYDFSNNREPIQPAQPE